MKEQVRRAWFRRLAPDLPFFCPARFRGPRSRTDQVADSLPGRPASWLPERPTSWRAQLYINEPGVVSTSPVSSQVFSPERIIGHPP